MHASQLTVQWYFILLCCQLISRFSYHTISLLIGQSLCTNAITCTHIHMHTYIHTYIFICERVHVCVHAHTDTNMHMQHMHTHTHTHIYKDRCACAQTHTHRSYYGLLSTCHQLIVYIIKPLNHTSLTVLICISTVEMG